MSEVIVTQTQQLLDHYRETVVVTDGYGRALTVSRLKPSDRRKVFEMTTSTSPAVYLPMLYAASVRSINATGENVFLTFPKTIAEMDARLDLIGDKGQLAIEDAQSKLNPPASEPETEAEKAKNSPGTPG